jgi:gliding motility-associated-like protein
MKLKTHLVFVTILLLVLAGKVVGQGFCDQTGGFTLNKAGGCGPFTVILTNTVAGADPRTLNYYYNYQKGSNTLSGGTNATSNTFSAPGPYTILQTGSVGGRSFSQCEDIVVYQSAPVNAEVISCGGGNVSLTFTNNNVLQVYDEIEINWGDGSEIKKWRKGDALNLEHTYINTSVRPTIRIKGIYIGNSLCQEGQLLSLPVTFEQANLGNIQVTNLDMLSNGNLAFTYKGIDGIKTQVQYSTDGSANFTNGENWSLGGVNTFSIKQLNKTIPYTVRLMSVDNCGGSLQSKEITSMAIKAESSGGAVKLSWNKYPVAADFTSYELYRNGNLIETFNDIDEISFTDTDVDCGDFEVYSVKAILVGASSQSAEEAIRVNNSGSLGLEKASVSVSGNGVLIMAEASGKSYDLTIERAESKDGLFRRIMILNSQNEYLDNNNIQPSEKSYCYKLSYSSCGQQYPATPPLCTILLEKKHSTFTWSDHLPFLVPIESYTMLQTGSSGSAQEVAVDQNPYTPKLNSDSGPEYTFQIKAVSDNGKLESLSNAITFKRSADVFFPNAFSPNGDFKNDDIKPIATDLASYNFTIYNRWGGVLFHTDNQALGWDGMVKNQLAELGWYLYKVSFVDDLNQKVEKRGTFMLLR